MEKPDATIVDFTAGNRSIWTLKDSPHILFLDKEPDLSLPPDLLCDATNTDLPPDSKFFAVFDPPHEWGKRKNSSLFTTPNRETWNKKWPSHSREAPPVYYGADKYQTKTELMRFIYETQREIARVLIPGGILFFKWSENSLSTNEVLEYLPLWDVALRIPVGYAGKTAKQSYWLLMIQKQGPWPQPELLDFFKSTNSKSKRIET